MCIETRCTPGWQSPRTRFRMLGQWAGPSGGRDWSSDTVVAVIRTPDPWADITADPRREPVPRPIDTPR